MPKKMSVMVVVILSYVVCVSLPFFFSSTKMSTKMSTSKQVRLAIEAERDDLASNLIANKFDFESKSPKDGNSAFHLAVKLNLGNLVKDMLGSKIKDVNVKDGKNETALIHAVTNQNLRICEQLLEAHANPNAVSSVGYACIAIALDLGNEDIACLLTKYGARADLASAAYQSDTVFLTAIRMRFRRLAEMMLRRHSPSYAAQGEDINATLMKLLTSRGVDGETSLLQAVRHGCFVLAIDIVNMRHRNSPSLSEARFWMLKSWDEVTMQS